MVMLEACPLFHQLKPSELKVLKAAAIERSFSDKQEIFKEGDTGDGVYVVKEGQVQISTLVAQDVRRVFSTVLPGELFGEMAVIENKPRSASAVASGNTAVYFIPREALLRVVEISPQLSLSLLREISNRLREFNRQYIQEVVQAERLTIVGRFARSIVHDLKNPLNIISISAEITGMDKSTPETRREGKVRIIKQVERITDLVNEILEFTQGSQTTNFVPAPTDYATFVRHVIEEIRPEIQLKSTTIEFENEPPSVKLHLNPKRLRRVFYNLIYNATDAMPRGGRILIRFSANGKGLTTEIEDAGSGIAPEIAGQLFNAFATYGKVHGTGLGLSICKKVVEDHRGTISARNEPGRGAVFSFTLPVHQA